MMDSGWSPDCEQRPAIAGSWSVLKTSSITWDGYDDSENKALPEGLSPRPQLEVQPGDILVTRAGQAYRTGVVAMVDSTDGKRMISDKLVRIRVDPAQITPILASEILKSDGVQSQLNPLKSGLTTLTNVTQKMIADLTFLLAPLADQSTFTNYLLAADTSIKSCRMQAMSLRRLKPYIVSDLLSGRVRVPA
jgi:type I restriction enzyme S subunit